MSTVEELLNADIKESSARYKRYWRSSTLPVLERRYNKPRPSKHPRDRVLKRIISLNMKSVIDGLRDISE